MSKIPAPPKGLKATGRRIWTDVLSEFELSEHEHAMLREACRTADSLDALQDQLEADGVMSESSQGVRVHPALVELRAQRVTLARLFAALRLPTGEEDGKSASRAVRGVYGIKGIAK